MPFQMLWQTSETSFQPCVHDADDGIQPAARVRSHVGEQIVPLDAHLIGPPLSRIPQSRPTILIARDYRVHALAGDNSQVVEQALPVASNDLQARLDHGAEDFQASANDGEGLVYARLDNRFDRVPVRMDEVEQLTE